MAKIQSVEPNVADLANGWLKSYKLDYKLEQESLNTEIDQALNDYYSKNGGVGGNRPDAKLLLQDKNLVNYPILIEYKGYKDKLVKLDVDGKVANKTSKNQPDFKNINSYAVNGAVHYANALLHYTSYTDIIAIGMTGYKNDAGKLEYEIGVYYVSKSNFGVGQKVDDFTDLSFLKKSNFDAFIEKVKQLQLSQEEIEKLREHREQEINASLVKLNNDIYNNEKGLSERDRVYLVAASIIATLGVPGKVAALEKSELKSSTEEGNRDGDIIVGSPRGTRGICGFCGSPCRFCGLQCGYKPQKPAWSAAYLQPTTAHNLLPTSISNSADFSMGTGSAGIAANAPPCLPATGAWHAPVTAPTEEQSSDSSAERRAGQGIPAAPAPVLPRSVPSYTGNRAAGSAWRRASAPSPDGFLLRNHLRPADGT